MGHKTDMRRYSRSIDAVARARSGGRPKAHKRADSPEIEICRQELGRLEIADSRYPGPKHVSAWLVVEF
jgi:hypothetical protein